MSLIPPPFLAALDIADAPLPPKPDTSCPRCLARWPRPGPCDWCASRIPPEPPAPEVATGRARVIPQMFRAVTWENLPSLRADDGAPRVQADPKGLPRMRAQLSGYRRAVLLGPAGSGKTTVAAAWARAAIDAGVDRVRWFSSVELRDNAPRESTRPGGAAVLPVDLAVSADALVLDDLGAELDGAQPRSGLLAQRIGPCSRVIGERFDLQRPTLITTGFELDGPETAPGLRQLYGDRIARRIFEGAAVVRVGRQNGPSGP